MNILQVSSTDLIGKRFNGQYLTELFPSYGHNAHQLVWSKDGNNENTRLMVDIPLRRTLQKISDKIEDKLSIRSVLHPMSFLIKNNPYFKSADVVHYQIMHWPNFFSLSAFPKLTSLKPSVWTLHDMWALSGHCVCSFDCLRWQTGCGKCPHLKTDFSMRHDRTRQMWKYKKNVYKKSKFQIVVASKLMQERVATSPLFKDFEVNLVPFGLDLSIYKPINSSFSRKLLGISDDEVVIAFRSSRSEFKGLQYLLSALRELKTSQKICLLSFDEKWNLEEFRNRFKIVDLGWAHDESLLKHAYDAADFFVMPSIQESFGMMSVEAMAFGKPVIVFDGTALPGVIGGNDNGIVVKSKDVHALSEAISALVESKELRESKGQSALRHVQQSYSIETHISSLLGVYEKAIRDHHNEKGG